MIRRNLLFILLFSLISNAYCQVSLKYWLDGNEKMITEDYKGAVLDYSKAIKLNPNFIAAYENRGKSKLYLKDYRGAIIDFNRAIELNPDNADYFVYRSDAKSKLLDFDGALNDINTFIVLQPNNCFGYKIRGIIEIGQGNLESGCLDLSKSGEIGCPEAFDIIKELCN